MSGRPTSATSAAAKTPGLVSLPQPLDLAGHKADLITSGPNLAPLLLKIELHRPSGWQPGPIVLDTVDIPQDVLLDQAIARPQCHHLFTLASFSYAKDRPRPFAWSITNRKWAGGEGPLDVVLATHPQNSVHHHCKSSAKQFTTGCDNPTSDLVIKYRVLHLSPTPGRVTLQSKHPVPSLVRTMSDASMLYRDLTV